jgi:hypothetical protein
MDQYPNFGWLEVCVGACAKTCCSENSVKLTAGRPVSMDVRMRTMLRPQSRAWAPRGQILWHGRGHFGTCYNRVPSKQNFHAHSTFNRPRNDGSGTIGNCRARSPAPASDSGHLPASRTSVCAFNRFRARWHASQFRTPLLFFKVLRTISA